MRAKIWLSCGLAILVIITWAVWEQRKVPTDPRPEAKTDDSRAGVSPGSPSQGRSDPARSGVATGTGRSGSGPANLRQPNAGAMAGGRDAHSTTRPAVEPMAADLPDPVATATIRVGAQTYQERSNEHGVFNVIRIQERQQVALEVVFSQGDPGQRVVAMVEDGGTLRDGQRVLPMQLDARRTVAFDFTASENRGVYRIRLRRGTETKMVQFWAGEPLALASH